MMKLIAHIFLMIWLAHFYRHGNENIMEIRSLIIQAAGQVN